jgi:hypothetical protein
MDSVVAAKLVMPGLVLGIHILARVERSHGREPGHDEKRVIFKPLERASKFWLLLPLYSVDADSVGASYSGYGANLQA